MSLMLPDALNDIYKERTPEPQDDTAGFEIGGKYFYQSFSNGNLDYITKYVYLDYTYIFKSHPSLGYNPPNRGEGSTKRDRSLQCHLYLSVKAPIKNIIVNHLLSTPDMSTNPSYTVFIRLPFPRGDFVDPPSV